MTELSLILSLDFAVVLLVAALVRWVFAHDAEPAEARSLVTAVRGALGSFRVRQGKRAFIASAVTCLVLALLTRFYSGLPQATGYAVAGVVLGAMLSTLVGQAALSFGVRAASATASALKGPSSSAVILPLRSGSAVALGTDAFVSIVMAVVLLLLQLAKGSADGQWLLLAQVLFAGLALGSVGGAVVAQFSGSATAAAGAFGRYQLPEDARHSRLQLDPKNPAMVLSAMGPHIGPMVTRAQDIACLSVLSQVTTVVATLVALSETATVSSLALLSLPLLIRSCGLAASAAAIMSLRADDGDDPLTISFRGQLAASVMSAAGMAGACRWLLGPDAWLTAISVALLGLVGHVVLAIVARVYVERRSQLLRSVREAGSASSETSVGLGLALGGVLASGTLIWLVAVLLSTWALGSLWPIDGGVVVGAGLCLAGFLSTLPFSLSLGSADPLMESACGIASLSRDGAHPQTRARLAALDFVAAGGRSMAQTHFTSASALLTTVLALVLGIRVIGQSDPSASVIAAASFAGAAFILCLSSLACRHVSLTVAGSAAESLRQLRAFPRNDRGEFDVPSEFSPSYRDQLDKAFDAALGRLLVPSGLCLVMPLGLGALTRTWLGADQLALALACFLFMCAITSLALGSLATTAGGLLAGAHRHSRSNKRAQQWALSRGELFASVLDTSLGPASRFALIGATAASAVLVAMVL